MSEAKPNICIIDDDLIYQFAARKIIETTGLAGKISVFSNGEEAINFFKTNKDESAALPEIIFLDVNMPVMDGWGFLEEYKSLAPLVNKKIIIYVVSSSSDCEDIDRAKKFSSVEDYIVKPIHKEKFASLLSLQRA